MTKRPIRSIELPPYRFFADTSQPLGQCMLENGFNYERHVVAELRRLVPAATGFLDLGANCGIHTVIAKTIKPDLPVVAVECNYLNLDLLCRNVAFNKLTNVTVLPFAAGPSPAVIYGNEHDFNMCVTLDGQPDSENYPVPLASLPLDLLNLPLISLVKADVEGFELHAFAGMTRIMAGRPTVIFEWCPEIAHRSGADPAAFLNYFLERNYQLTTLDYQPGMRATFTAAAPLMQHVANTSKWICDILAEPVDTPAQPR